MKVMTRIQATLAVLLAVLVLASATPAHAQSNSPKAVDIVGKVEDVGGGDDVAASAKSAGIGWVDLGSPITGSLGPGDDFLGDGSYADYWFFDVPRSGYIEIEMTSRSVDAYLLLHTMSQIHIESDDDSGDGLDARLFQYLRAGSYQVTANSYDADDTGSYVLSVRYAR